MSERVKPKTALESLLKRVASAPLGAAAVEMRKPCGFYCKTMRIIDGPGDYPVYALLDTGLAGWQYVPMYALDYDGRIVLENDQDLWLDALPEGACAVEVELLRRDEMPR